MKKKALIRAGAAAAVAGFTAFMVRKLLREPLETVEYVDLKRYMGKWYEIATIPHKFEEGCTFTTAEYSLNDDGSVTVKNSCKVNGELKVATAKAFIADTKTNARLDVQFLWPFKGKYWIIDLADDYSYAMVGHPNRRYLWILSRTPLINRKVFNQLVEAAYDKGFDVSMLRITMQ